VTTILVCPRCRGALSERPADSGDGAYACEACRLKFPIVFGIPDLRLQPDPYLDFEADRAKGLQLAERYEDSTARELSEYYWDLTPDVPRDMVRRFLRHSEAAQQRGRRLLESARDLRGTGAAGSGSFLELGCRAGGVLVAAAPNYSSITGIDIAFRWLVVARKRLEENRIPGTLVCCSADALPFADETFDCVVAENVLEYTAGQEAVVSEAHRVTQCGGHFVGVTWNRFAVAAEPHVRLWGVGFLPRPWMEGFVRWRRGVPYRHIRLVSVGELRRLLASAPFDGVRLSLPELDSSQVYALSGWPRFLARAYNRVRCWPLFRRLFLGIAPILAFSGRATGKPVESIPGRSRMTR
jgi:SAM-dependent methyltransferase